MSKHGTSHSSFLLWNVIVGIATVLGLMWAVYTWAYDTGSREQVEQMALILSLDTSDQVNTESIGLAFTQLQHEAGDAKRGLSSSLIKIAELNEQLAEYSDTDNLLIQTQLELKNRNTELSSCHRELEVIQERMSKETNNSSRTHGRIQSLETENTELRKRLGLDSSIQSTIMHDISYRVDRTNFAGEGILIELTALNTTAVRKSIQIHGPTFFPGPQVRTIDGQEFAINRIRAGQQSTSGRWLTISLPANGAIKLAFEVNNFPSNIRRLDSLEFAIRTDRSPLTIVSLRNILVGTE
ncbi:MAG: hypothetical protein O7G85_16520 [Planctomycetota bacterium]|nr:hypothetical protein [Planctomycetota bacterium]